MKKVFFAMAVLAAAALTSCVEEQQINNEVTPVGEGGIAFAVKSSPATRSDADGAGISFPLGTDAVGNPLFLEETVVDLNGSEPVTKGAPAYTENVRTLYTRMGTIGMQGSTVVFPEADFTPMDEEMVNGGWRYNHYYSGKHWPDLDSKVEFYLRMPSQMTGVSNLAYADKKFAFDYVSPATATAQQDIVFTTCEVSQREHGASLPNGTPVTFYHALSGVRFRIGSDNDGTTKTIVTKVEFVGLANQGHCSVFPTASTPADRVVWSDVTATSGSSASQTFTGYTYSQTKDNTINYTSDMNFGTSWSAAGTDTNNPANTKNLNDTTGTLTFWFIPQAFTESSEVQLKVSFKVYTPDTQSGGTEYTHTIANFGATLGKAGVIWKAGQLRTYTINPKDVDVAIIDTLARTTTGIKKSGLHVTNTGNVKEFVRMQVMGNWYGWESAEEMAAHPDDPSIIVGYKYSGNEDIADVDPDDYDEEHPDAWKSVMADYWVRNHPVYGTGFDESFQLGVLPAGSKWKRGDGGYYYLDPIGPGQALGSGTEPLFQYYEFKDEWTPTLWIPDPESNTRRAAVGVHLVMEIAVQSIGAEKPDGTLYDTCWEAWSAATGLTIGPKN